MLKNLIIIIFSGTSIWLAIQWLDMRSNLEAGTVNEMRLELDRKFLIQLPSLLKETYNRDQLIRLLQEKYPNVQVNDLGQDICWGALRLKLTSSHELSGISESCDER